MNSSQEEVVRIGGLNLRFLVDGERSQGGLCVFEMTVPPDTRVPMAHYHQVVDEAVYGLEGIMTYTVNGERREIGPGAHCFGPRGAVHHFTNAHVETARVLTVLSPASIGPAYFREIADLLSRGGPPDRAKLTDIMLRHGLVPAAG